MQGNYEGRLNSFSTWKFQLQINVITKIWIVQITDYISNTVLLFSFSPVAK